MSLNIFHPERPYRDIDKFYWLTEDWESIRIPLSKKHFLEKEKSNNYWSIRFYNSIYFDNQYATDLSFSDSYYWEKVEKFNNIKGFIFFYSEDEEQNNYSVLVNIKKRTGQVFDKRNIEKFKTKLKELGLPNDFFTPDKVYQQFKMNPELPWFPEDIKQQLRAVKAKKEQKN